MSSTEVVKWDDDGEDRVSPKKYGSLNQETIESLLVGYLIHDDDDSDPITNDKANAEKILNAGVEGSMFKNDVLGSMFDDFSEFFRRRRSKINLETARAQAMLDGQSNDDGQMLVAAMARCHGALLVRRVDVNTLLDRFKQGFYVEKAHNLYEDFVKEIKSTGPNAALDNFRNRVRTGLVDATSAPLREYDIGGGMDGCINWILDKKHSPSKHKGAYCGIPAFDVRTTGFHPGQLTVLVGRHGGYKTTGMINITHGLFVHNYNVLYASLEMEAHLMMAKFLCRYSRRLRWSKMGYGYISEPEDWDKLEAINKALGGADVSSLLTPWEDEEEYAAILDRLKHDPEEGEVANMLARQKDRLELGLNGVTRGREDSVVAKQIQDEINSRENRVKILNVGQSEKVKVGQLEAWIEEKSEDWRPDVVVVDYLALVDSDTSYKDRRDLEVGDVCKRFRQMGMRGGYHVVTAAQYKRAAIERVRKYGLDKPERAGFQTDDIAESNQIGADADSVFCLWPEDGGNRLRVFTPKARHTAPGDENGVVLQVDNDHVMIAEDIESTLDVSEGVTLDMMYESAATMDEGSISLETPDEIELGGSEIDDIFSAEPLPEEDDIEGLVT